LADQLETPVRQVLYVEDDPLFYIPITNLLEKAGYQVLFADSEPEAIALIEALPGNLTAAILDLDYGYGGNAVGVIDALITAGQKVPLIIVSGSDFTPSISEMIRIKLEDRNRASYDQLEKIELGKQGIRLGLLRKLDEIIARSKHE
jgi:CheY-like chemotaxis protein